MTVQPIGRNAAVWESWLRRAPLGVLVLSMLLGLLGAGVLLTGVYLGLARPDIGWRLWLGALLIGPLSLYVGLRLLTLAPWTWTTMVALLSLLLVSSCVRAVLTPERIPTVPLVEIALEIAVLAYLVRPSVRAAFGRA